MSRKYFGRATIKVNGMLLESKPGARLNLGGTRRSEVIHDQGAGFSEQLAPSSLECEVVLGQDLSLADVRDLTDATVTFDADTGQSFLIANAWQSEPPTVTSGDGGGVSLNFMGDPAEEV